MSSTKLAPLHIYVLFYLLRLFFQVEVMATRKLGRGKGALRTISSSPVPGSLAAASRSDSPCTVFDTGNQHQVAEVRVTGITDVTSFWVQMGTGTFR